MDKGFYNFRGSGSRFKNSPIDRRRLNMRDRSDLNRGGEYQEQSRAFSRAKQVNGERRRRQNRDMQTTAQNPGTGGQSPGIGIQQERYRRMGQENWRQEQNRPDMEDPLYDIYKFD